MSGDPIELTLPDGLELVRTTPEFDESTVPPALLNAHEIAAGVWGRLVVTEGGLDFVFEDQAEEPRPLGPGESIVIPPQRPHRVVITGPAHFSIEFYRTPARSSP
jgi:tellurite resistance-related uncharacterized protein